jgi:hypothetical protein
MPQFGSERPAHPVAIQLAGLDSRQVNMPVVRGATRLGNEIEGAAWLGSILRVEE